MGERPALVKSVGTSERHFHRHQLSDTWGLGVQEHTNQSSFLLGNLTVRERARRAYQDRV